MMHEDESRQAGGLPPSMVADEARAFNRFGAALWSGFRLWGWAWGAALMIASEIMAWSPFWLAGLFVLLMWLLLFLGSDALRGDLLDAALAIWRRVSVVRAQIIVRADADPTDWPNAPQNETHAGYRAEYERIAAMPDAERDEAAYLGLAEVLRALQRYGDNPLARPVLRAPRRLFAAPALSGLTLWIGGALFLWASLATSAALLLNHARAEAASARDEAVRVAHAWRDNARGWRRAHDAAAMVHAGDVARAVAQAERDIQFTLEQRRLDRLRAERERARNARQADPSLEPVDFGDVVRGLAEPALAGGPPDDADAAGASAVGAVSDGAEAAPDDGGGAPAPDRP